MSVTSVDKDFEALTMTITADLDATVERAWQLWADPRQFERWWGPPGMPPTVVDHDLRVGGRITFFTTVAEGERVDSTWEVVAAEPPCHLEVRDADVDYDGRPNDGNSMTALVVTIGEHDGGGAVMEMCIHFDSQVGMEQVLAVGVEEGMSMVFAQIDEVLAGTPA
ncbi:MAG: SRPBCC family protein [Acidimicrobiales bacterium]